MFRWFLIIAFVIFSSVPPRKCCCVMRGISQEATTVPVSVSIEKFLHERAGIENSTPSVLSETKTRACCQKSGWKAHQSPSKVGQTMGDSKSRAPGEACSDADCQIGADLGADCGCDDGSVGVFQESNHSTTPKVEHDTKLLFDAFIDSDALTRGVENSPSAYGVSLLAISRSNSHTACDRLCRWLC